MAQTIKLKRSSVSGNTPGTSDLELGEVAINTYDGKMFIKKNDGSDSIVEIGGTSGTVTEAFKTIAVSGQNNVVADSATDTLTLVAGSNMTITTNASGDTVTFASSGGGGTQNVFNTFAVSGQSSVVADSTTDTLTLAAGSGINITTNAGTDTITIAATASAITVQDEGSALSTAATTLNFVGAGVTASGTGATKTITIPGTGTVSEAFKTIAVSGQSNVVADGATDTLTLAAGSGMTITTNASNDTITFASSGGGGSQNVFSNIAVSGQGTVQADATTDTLTVVAGSGIALTTDTSADSLTITNTGTVNVANAASSIKEFKYDISSSTTTITGSDANSNTLAYEAEAIQVFLNGILLDPATDYTASNGTSIVLTDAAVSGDDVQIVAFNRKIVTANVGLSTFTGDGTTTAFTLSSDPVHENNTRVHIDGVYQEKAAYAVSGTTLTFSGAPPNNSSIEVEIGFTQAEIGSTLDFADNAILRIGTGNDLQILHDGSNSIIKDTGTGDLQIAASTLEVKNSGLNETMIKAIEDGAVELYHDNAKKLETVTGGVTITGTVTATTFSGDLSGTINTATTGATQSASDNSTKLATTAYVTTALSNLVDSAPGTLNTLNELAAALGDDANFSTTITNSLATKVGLTATTGAANMPAGTTAQRPGSPAAGQFRYNSTLSQFEGYTSSWGAIGGGGTNTFTTDTLTTSGSATVTLSQAVSSPNDCIVHIDGIYQTPTDAYTVSGTTLTFTATPASGRKVVVYSVKAGVSGNNLNTQTFSGNGSATSFTMNVNPINENNTIVHIDGVYQQKSSYSTSGTTLAFSAAPANGTTIEVATFTQTEINVPVNDTIDTVHIKDDAVTSAKLGGNLVAPGTVTASAGFVGPLTGNVTGNVSGTAATVTTAAQTNITSLGTLTTLTVDDITINGSTISDAADLTLDVAGNISLDADDSGHVRFKDGGTEYISIYQSSSDAILQSSIQDKDILFKGNDGGSTITALILDMSEGGKATFANDIAVADNRGLRLGSDNDSVIYNDGSNLYIKNNTSNQDIIFQGNDDGSTGTTALTLDMSDAGKATFNAGAAFGNDVTISGGLTTSETIYITGDNHDLIISSNDHENVYLGNRGASGTNLDKGYFRMKSESTNTVVIDTAGNSFFNGGNVGIGTNNPGELLHVSKSVDDEVSVRIQNSNGGSSAYAALYLQGDGNNFRIKNWGDGTSKANATEFISTAGSSQFIFAPSNSEAMRIDSSGNVGIGVTPSAPIDVVTNSTVWTGEFTQSNTSNGDGVLISVGSTAAADYALSVRTNAGAHSGLAVKADGKTGIGTFSPEHSLHVLDYGSSSDATIKVGGSGASLGLEISYSQASTTIANIVSNPTYTNNGAKLRLAVDGDRNANQLVLNGEGNIGIGILDPATYYDTVLHLHDAGAGTNTHIKITNGTTGASQGDGTDLLAAGSDFYVINREATGTVRFLTNSLERMRIDADGAVTKPYQPAFSATRSGSDVSFNANTTTVIPFQSEIFDQNADYNASNYHFTAPVTGKYQFNLIVRLNDIDESTDYYILYIRTSNRNYYHIIDSGCFDLDPNYYTMQVTVLADMDSGDQAWGEVYQTNGANQSSIDGGNGSNSFSGYLVA